MRSSPERGAEGFRLTEIQAADIRDPWSQRLRAGRGLRGVRKACPTEVPEQVKLTGQEKTPGTSQAPCWGLLRLSAAWTFSRLLSEWGSAAGRAWEARLSEQHPWGP